VNNFTIKNLGNMFGDIWTLTRIWMRVLRLQQDELGSSWGSAKLKCNTTG
jgi:hypothetical protein